MLSPLMVEFIHSVLNQPASRQYIAVKPLLK
ncbi:hypothetical protein YPC_3423 [Yersinia pestis biovar Medievalis str. Harbin 35]|nr:hypothetical protein YPC_3423 [Yersinia pestis biovar Medievalis str. Harbin 35]EEO77368.1 hypothetical protein YP516_1029 [Yersinia pestis Nepal516]EEO79786.1 hypothetical protein YPF_3781 [Yersinia pestis biovar Orientalis str. India 195]EEO85156.1 hypothetical protein YPH_0998 [Yersinia pestis biovar Orientalis str. PEXU2]EEO89056.1 hypothetical protein YPS_3915 [Yersinia pestis Pestoides A]QOW15234.1 hypothetical protein S96127_2931 [Yersinia pestis]